MQPRVPEERDRRPSTRRAAASRRGGSRPCEPDSPSRTVACLGRGRCHLPDLRALVRRLERRRDRGSARGGEPSSTTSPGSASTRSGSARPSRARTSTGATTSPTTCGVHPDFGTLDDLDVADRRGSRARDQHLARSRPEPHLGPPRLVQRSSRVLRLVGRDPERLALDLLRWERLGVRHTPPALLPPSVRGRAARPRLVEHRGPGRVRPHPPSLVRSRRRRLPRRRRARADQGPRAS